MRKIFGFLVVTAALAGLFAYWVVLSGNVSPGPEGEVRIYLSTGSSFAELMDEIEERNALKSPWSFRLLAKYKEFNQPKGGSYLLKAGMTNNEIINKLRVGEQDAVKFTFTGTDHLEKICGKAGERLEMDSARLCDYLYSPEFRKLVGENKDLKLFFIPNTYHLYWNIPPSTFGRRMLDEYHRFWTEERKKKAASRGLNPEKAAILASIVDKETSVMDEMPVVAGLYLNRLNKGWKLQSDPTVIYAMRRTNPGLEVGRVLFKDLEFESPYNTYIHKGLPPGPITIPSVQAIEAVLKPAEHAYLYMCADPERPGRHQFAKTNAEHNRNKAKYIQWLENNNIRR